MTGGDAGLDFSFNRVRAMVRRYWYLLCSSWPRVLDLIVQYQADYQIQDMQVGRRPQDPSRARLRLRGTAIQISS